MLVRASSALCDGSADPVELLIPGLQLHVLLMHTLEARPPARDLIERYIRYSTNRTFGFCGPLARAQSIACLTLAHDLTSEVIVSAVAAAIRHHFLTSLDPLAPILEAHQGSVALL